MWIQSPPAALAAAPTAADLPITYIIGHIIASTEQRIPQMAGRCLILSLANATKKNRKDRPKEDSLRFIYDLSAI